jgi:tRNA modification GTPase
MVLDSDPIAAIATPPGRGGVGIVRVSGGNLHGFLKSLLAKAPEPRRATFCRVANDNGEVIDEALLLFFPGPHSFTGEDVIELHGHGGPVVMDELLARMVSLGARLARPGEFSERAFLNGKLDLAQAEAIADLIDASSSQAARSAVRSLQGEFSRRVHGVVEQLIQLRTYVEAAIDFSDEEIDFLGDGKVEAAIEGLVGDLDAVIGDARQGALLREGMTVAIAGKPNAGKSSLLNALSGRDAAIVTDIAGTTRDVLRESIHLDGMPLHVVDTAGLRESTDKVEREGIRRAWREIEHADRVLFVVDLSEGKGMDIEAIWPEFFRRFPGGDNLTVIFNKADLVGQEPIYREEDIPTIRLSAKTGEGMAILRDHLKACMGYRAPEAGGFIARRRHLDALGRARDHLHDAWHQLRVSGAGELAAEDLRYAQNCLGEITGEFSADDLLGRIFSSFCIGK